MAFDRRKIPPRFFLPEYTEIRSLAGMFGRSFRPRNVTRVVQQIQISRLLEIRRNGITHVNLQIVYCAFVENLIDEGERCKFKDLLNILLVMEQSLHLRRTRRTLRNLFFPPHFPRKRKRKKKKDFHETFVPTIFWLGILPTRC